MESLCYLHAVHEPADKIKACPSLSTDPLKFKALFVLAFPEFVMVGHAEAWSGVPGVDSAAKEELCVMRDNDFEPSQILTMRKLIGRCNNSESLEQHANSVFSTQFVHTKTLLFKDTAYISVKQNSSQDGVNDGIRYLWHYADRVKGGWSAIGGSLKFPVLRHPLQIFWQRLSRASEVVRNLGFRNPAGLLSDLEGTQKEFLAVACLMTVRSDNFITARLVTVLPCSDKNTPTLMCLLSSLSMYSELDLLVKDECIVGCKVSGITLDIHDSHISANKLLAINHFRKCLADIWQLTTLTSTAKLAAARSAFDDLFATRSLRVISPPMISTSTLPWETGDSDERDKPDIPLQEFCYFPQLDLTSPSTAVPDFSVRIPVTENWDEVSC